MGDMTSPISSSRPEAVLLQTNRRTALVAAASAALAVALPGRTLAEDATMADVLFVQTAKSMRYDAANKQIVLEGVSPVTLFFADRPDRVAGNMQTVRFVPFWSEGKDSFLSDPPNADLSSIVDGALQQTVVVLRDPKIDGDNLSYQIEVISGEVPAAAQDVSVFIDIIGMPLTPLSYAGVARRTFRRAAIY
jgi:hypothetical protein